MNSKDNIMQVENPQLVGREQMAVYVPVNDILNGMAEDPDGRFRGKQGDPGPEGVGIMSISVGANNNLVIQLTNGNTYDVNLPFVEESPGSSGGGTKITVGGVEVSSWSADIKLDKITSTVNNRGDRVYAIGKNGSQKTIYAETTTNASTIPLRDSNGQLIVKDIPTAYNHAASKRYVDNAIAAGGGGSAETHMTTFTGDTASYLLDNMSNHFVTIALESSMDPYPIIMTTPIYLPINDPYFMPASLSTTIYTDRFTTLNYPDSVSPTTPLDFGLLKLEYDTTGSISISFNANDPYFAGIGTVYIIDQAV